MRMQMQINICLLNAHENCINDQVDASFSKFSLIIKSAPRKDAVKKIINFHNRKIDRKYSEWSHNWGSSDRSIILYIHGSSLTVKLAGFLFGNKELQ